MRRRAAEAIQVSGAALLGAGFAMVALAAGTGVQRLEPIQLVARWLDGTFLLLAGVALAFAGAAMAGIADSAAELDVAFDPGQRRRSRRAIVLGAAAVLGPALALLALDALSSVRGP